MSQEAANLRQAIAQSCLLPEPVAVARLLDVVGDDPQTPAVLQRANEFVRRWRERSGTFGMDALMAEYALSSKEGAALLNLAEAFARIPDIRTADRLIVNQLAKGDWRSHIGGSSSFLVNATSLGLSLAERVLSFYKSRSPAAALVRLLSFGSEPIIRESTELFIRMMGGNFVCGETIEDAFKNSRACEAQGYRFSYDMLGEAALTQADAERYYRAYEHAIHVVGRISRGRGIKDGPGMSIKLSALHPRYSRAQKARVMDELLPRLMSLFELGKHYDVGISIDAEECDRLDLSLDLFTALLQDGLLAGYAGCGFVVQAYQKRCLPVIDYLVDLARRAHHPLMIRLVKGAYWDTEIKLAQIKGLADYPVYTRKEHTDLSYLAAARRLLDAGEAIYPQFATHNALTVSTLWHWIEQEKRCDVEFQGLYGMAAPLYNQIVGSDSTAPRSRIYAPVGRHSVLLPYLVRRLLENGANTSFVHKIQDSEITADDLLVSPVTSSRACGGQTHPAIPLPTELYAPQRRNSRGTNLDDELDLQGLLDGLARWREHQWQAEPRLSVDVPALPTQPVRNPAKSGELVGHAAFAAPEQVQHALASASDATRGWRETLVERRAELLFRAADLIEENRDELVALLVREAGRTLKNALSEIRETVDFLRYYARQVSSDVQGRPLGTIVCISPWNFPLAIFCGQIAGALATGNVVIAKPAEQTSLIASRAVELFHAAGIPREVLQFLPGMGETTGAALVASPRVAGVIFTGSGEVARQIHRTLAKRAGTENTMPRLIAETGGINAMIVDSSALPEQVIQDVLTSAFDSAGQRCSSLRILCLQQEIADSMLDLLRQGMRELRIGDPMALETDIGPLIDSTAASRVQGYIDGMVAADRVIDALPLPSGSAAGHFVAPTLVRVESVEDVSEEIFGPVLHVLTYSSKRLPGLIDAINGLGYGLTLGIHSRIDETIHYITEHARVGNVYVNRDMIGAVVGVQPFGGEGLSGTGPKAGGPFYLHRLTVENAFPKTFAFDHKVPVPTDALQSLITWLAGREYAAVAQCARAYAKSSPLGLEQLLPGPTGEENRLQLRPRGTILCYADSAQALLCQLAAVLTTGNRALVLARSETLIPGKLPDTVAHAITWVDSLDAGADDFQLALIEAPLENGVRTILTSRIGAIIPIVTTHLGEPIALGKLLVEHCVCTNQAAVGGNLRLAALK